MIGRDGRVNTAYYNIISNCLKSMAELSGDLKHVYSKLSPREAEICGLIKNGNSSKAIASALHVSLATVNKHREAIRRKLGLTNKHINLVSFLQKQ